MGIFYSLMRFIWIVVLYYNSNIHIFAMIFQILRMFTIIQIYASLHFFFMSASSYIYGSCEWFCNESSTFCSLDHKNVYIPVTVLYYNSNIRIFAMILQILCIFAMMQIYASLQYIYIYIYIECLFLHIWQLWMIL